MKFGQKLKEVCHHYDMTLDKLSEQSNISETKLKNYINGTQNPDSNDLYRISEVFEIPPQILEDDNIGGYRGYINRLSTRRVANLLEDDPEYPSELTCNLTQFIYNLKFLYQLDKEYFWNYSSKDVNEILKSLNELINPLEELIQSLNDLEYQTCLEIFTEEGNVFLKPQQIKDQTCERAEQALKQIINKLNPTYFLK